MSDDRRDPLVDPRGVRFSAALTTVVLAIVLVTDSTGLLATQAIVFALGAFGGLRRAPYSVLFRLAVAPRLRPPTEREEAAPVRFSQTVGFVFAAVGVLGLATGLVPIGLVATAFALVAAFLNAAFGYCLGCELYGPTARLRHSVNSRLRHGGVSA